MIIIFGSRLYGKVDEVPGLFHVATRFGHAWYLPLIPMGSYLVLGQEGDQWHGASIGLSVKSLLIAWLRVVLFIAAIGCVIAAIMRGTAAPQRGAAAAPWWPYALAAPILLGLWLWAMMGEAFRRASHNRAMALSRRVGLGEVVNALIDLHFGHISEEEAREIIEAAHAEQVAEAQPPPTEAAEPQVEHEGAEARR
jgi:hypothetical protein